MLLVHSSRRQSLRQARGLEEGALKGDLEKTKDSETRRWLGAGGSLARGPTPVCGTEGVRAQAHPALWTAGLHYAALQ